MFEKVLVATDFSKYAEKIIECAAEIPGVKEVVLLHVIARDPLARVWSPGDEIKMASARLDESKKALENMGLKVQVRGELSEENEEFKVIQRVADEENASLIVVGARGRSILGGILLGSVSTNVLRYGNKNLLIIRYKTIGSAEEAKLEKFCPRIFSKILCPTDFSDAGNAAIDMIKATKLTNNVVLLNVVARGETAEWVETRVKEAQKNLEDIKGDLAKEGINVTNHVFTTASGIPRTYGTGGMASVKTAPFVPAGSAAEKIMSFAEEQDVSLIALGSHGKSWLDEATIGSVVSDVARMGTRPVLIVRSGKKV